MAKDFSFDVVSDYDVGEMTNAFDQAKREIATRYDFKNTPANIEWLNGDKEGVRIEGDSQYQLDAVLDVFRGKVIKRGIPVATLDTSVDPVQGGKVLRWEVKFKKGLDQEQSKKIGKIIRDAYPKVKTQLQNQAVRVSSSSKDDLQGVMALLKKQDFDFPLQFVNYR